MISDTATIETLKAYFKVEIENRVIFGENEIIVELEDGTKAKITASILN